MSISKKKLSNRKDSIFGKNLKNILMERGINQKTACFLAGEIPASTLNDWINGVAPTDLNAVAKLSKALKADFQWLLTGIHSERSLIEDASLTEIFDIEEHSSASGLFMIEAKRLVRKKKIINKDGNK